MATMQRHRPTIHINSPRPHYNDLSFRHPPRKRKWSANDSSEDDEFDYEPYHIHPSSMYHHQRHSSRSSSSQPPGALSPTLAAQSPVGGGGNESSEGEHKHKRTKKLVPHLERGMDDMSLYGSQGIQRSRHNSLQHQLSPTPTIDTYQTLYTGPIVQESDAYRPTWDYSHSNSGYIVSELGHLDIDQEFIPREHDHDDELILPDIEEVPQTPQAYTVLTNNPLRWPTNNAADVKMSGTSWYEPEKDRECRPSSVQPPHPTTASLPPSSYDRPRARPNHHPTGIIITDLDDSGDDEPPLPPHSALHSTTDTDKANRYWDEDEQRFKTFEVSPAYLARFSGVPKPDDISRSIGGRKDDDSLALVAYRPPPMIPGVPRPPPTFQTPDAIEEVEELSDNVSGNVADSSNEVEFMDLDD
ncbi:hypothetical protein FRC17_003415 [Serendipita sp. 399]|nr:hypothetical protein FRC17_003415 [Serendipita sp. 399]